MNTRTERLVDWSTDHPDNEEEFTYEETPFALLLGTPDQWGYPDYSDEEESE